MYMFLRLILRCLHSYIRYFMFGYMVRVIEWPPIGKYLLSRLQTVLLDCQSSFILPRVLEWDFLYDCAISGSLLILFIYLFLFLFFFILFYFILFYLFIIFFFFFDFHLLNVELV